MKNTTRRILAIFASIGIVLGGIVPGQPVPANAQTVQQTKDAAENTSTLIESFTSTTAFDAGTPAVFGLVGKLGTALKGTGAVLGLVSIVLELAKQDTASADELILQSLDKANDKLDGIDQKLDRKFDELKIDLEKNAAFINLEAASKDIDAEFQRWVSNEVMSREKTPNTMIPEYLDADTVFRNASAVANICKGINNNDSIFKITAEANKKSYSTLPLLHVSISNRLYKAGSLGAYQRYRASYLTKLLEITKGTERPGQRENQIAEIEKNAMNSSIPFQQLRDQHLADAKRQAAAEMEPFWSGCEKAFTDTVTKYSDPASVKQAAQRVVENEFFTENLSGLAPSKLPLLLTYSNAQIFANGNSLGYGFSDDGKIDPTKAGGQFTAAIGKRLEDLFPGYGFVVMAYAQYDLPPTMGSHLSNRCYGATPVSWKTSEAFEKSPKKPLVWNNIPVDGPTRNCAGRADQYSLDLIVSGFQRAKAQDATTKQFLSSQSPHSAAMAINYHIVLKSTKADSEAFGKSSLETVSASFNPNLVSVFAALPNLVEGRRATPFYYLYPSKFTDMVFYPKIEERDILFYVVSPAPF